MKGGVHQIIVRTAGVDDAPAIARIHADSWRRHYRGMYSDHYLDGDLDADRLAAWTDRVKRDARTHCTLIAEEDGRALGFAHVGFNADPTWGSIVDNLHVVHSAQGRGIGSLLLDRVARMIIGRRPASGIYLWVLEQNEGATAFTWRVVVSCAIESRPQPPVGISATSTGRRSGSASLGRIRRCFSWRSRRLDRSACSLHCSLTMTRAYLPTMQPCLWADEMIFVDAMVTLSPA